ncbi:chaperone protein dnaJ 11, chloroplastic-like [Bidens hawaiensis]|uniref:chaperone protein dnaJ 11, chloroplastic-like n=1 Tax=Bidens hawaiensis TaxID=980011 RepID=UPI00404AE0C6
MAGTLTTSTGATSFNFLNNTRVPASGPGAPVHIKSRYAAPKASLHAVMDEPLVESRKNKSTSLYDVLNVKRNATPSEIKSAYRRLAKRYHPDASGAKKGSDRDFIDVHNVYVTFSDPTARAIYDFKLGSGFERRAGVYSVAGASCGVYTGRRWETDQCW